MELQRKIFGTEENETVMQKEVESWEPCDPKEGKDCESSTFFTTCNFQIILLLNSFIRWS